MEPNFAQKFRDRLDRVKQLLEERKMESQSRKAIIERREQERLSRLNNRVEE